MLLYVLYNISFLIPWISNNTDIEKGVFERVFIYRPGLLRLSAGRSRRREKSFRVFEWIARQFSDVFDLGDWWSISTDNLSRVMLAKCMSAADELENKHLQKVGEKNVLQINKII